MKKMLSTLLCGTIVLLYGGAYQASEINRTDDFDLIEYCETHEISSQKEFQAVIDAYTECPEEIYNTTGYSDISENDKTEVSFEIDIDYNNRIVTTTTVYETGINATASTKSGSIQRDYYNSAGKTIFIITVNGTFSYSSGKCSVTSGTANFTKPLLSGWNSTPTVSTGNSSVAKAYVQATGDATYGTSSQSYSVKLTCDSLGNLGS